MFEGADAQIQGDKSKGYLQDLIADCDTISAWNNIKEPDGLLEAFLMQDADICLQVPSSGTIKKQPLSKHLIKMPKDWEKDKAEGLIASQSNAARASNVKPKKSLAKVNLSVNENLCTSQGSRKFQKSLKKGICDEIDTILMEVQPELLMTSKYGNYSCQAIMDYCNAYQFAELVERTASFILPIATNIHGTHCLQKLIWMSRGMACFKIIHKALLNNFELIVFVRI